MNQLKDKRVSGYHCKFVVTWWDDLMNYICFPNLQKRIISLSHSKQIIEHICIYSNVTFEEKKCFACSVYFISDTQFVCFWRLHLVLFLASCRRMVRELPPYFMHSSRHTRNHSYWKMAKWVNKNAPPYGISSARITSKKLH